MNSCKLFKKNDIFIALILVLIAAAGFFAFRFLNNEEGNTVKITVDGEVFGSYSLSEVEKTVEIPVKNGICRLVIKDGAADMIYADCPNQICVHHAAISSKGESIVCLPNRVVAEIE